jgi:hypothetical protein
MPPGVAGLSPAQQAGISLLPGTTAPTAGLEGLLTLPAPVGAASLGLVGASGPTSAEDLALESLLGYATGGGDEGWGVAPALHGDFGAPTPDLAALAAYLPQNMSLDTVFPGISSADIAAFSPGVEAGTVPVLGGEGLDSITTSAPLSDLPNPMDLPEPQDLTDPNSLATLLPEGAQTIYWTLVHQGVPPAMAFSQALSQYVTATAAPPAKSDGGGAGNEPPVGPAP